MASFCIPVVLAEQLKAAAVAGEIDIAKMYDMTSKERRTLFESYVDRETARLINTGFEKAMVSSQQTALKKWAQDTFTGGEKKKTQLKDVLTKIDELNKTGLLTPQTEKAFLQDLVTEKLGVTVTEAEAKQISALSEKLQKLSEEESEFGTPTLEYFEARKEMEDYLESITPSTQLSLVSSIIARGNLLFRVSSPLLNIESNSVQGVLQAFSRRLENRSIGGVNNDYAIKYAKFVNKVYSKTRFDMSRMMTLDAERTLKGEEQLTTQGEGKVRAVARFYEDKIFNKLLGAPDVVFSSIAFSDRANIESSKMARSEGLTGQKATDRSLEIFKDATRIDPKTKEGKVIRQSAMADSFYSTYTNKSVYSDIALGIRNLFNVATGDARVGDQIMPFVKTPANVIGTGLNMSGIGLPIDASYRAVKVLNDIRKGEGFKESMKSEYQGFGRSVIQAGLGVSIAFVIASMFEPEDFIGEFPVSEKERQLLALRNATTNSVKIGNRWVSLDYFGPLGTALVGLLYAKKYGDTLADKTVNYVKGALTQSAKIPGFTEAYDAIKALEEATPKAGETAQDVLKSIAGSILSFVQSRSTPGLLYDLAKMTDTVDRKVSKDVLDKLKNAIPGLRQTLPEKKNVFAETNATEPWLSTLFFGSRVKTDKNDPVVKELLELDKTGNLPSITDVSKTSPRAQQLKEQIGEERFNEAMTLMGTKLKEKIETIISTDAYKNASEEKKKSVIDSYKNKIFEAVLSKYGYKKPVDVPTTRPTSQAGSTPLATLTDGINNLLSSITPTVSAAGGEKGIKSISVDGRKVTTIYEDGTFKISTVNNKMTLAQELGKVLNDVGTALGLPELNLSENLDYVTDEDRIKELLAYNDQLQGKVTENKPEANKSLKEEITVNAAELPESTPLRGYNKDRGTPKKEYVDIISESSKKHEVQDSVVAAMLFNESGIQALGPEKDNINYDKVTGKEKSRDRGIAQINSAAHPEITPEQAYDPKFAINFMAKKLAGDLKYFNGDITLAIAAYNVGRGGANQRYEAGRIYLDKIYKNMDSDFAKEIGFDPSTY